jgi:hypothetical protein
MHMLQLTTGGWVPSWFAPVLLDVLQEPMGAPGICAQDPGRATFRTLTTDYLKRAVHASVEFYYGKDTTCDCPVVIYSRVHMAD